MILVLPLLLTAALGVLIMNSALARKKLPGSWGLICATAFPVGFAVISLALFFSYLMIPSSGFFLTQVILGLTSAALIVYTIWHNRQTAANWPCFKSARDNALLFWKNTSWLEKAIFFTAGFLFLFALFRILASFQHWMLYDIFGGWDARFFWNVKAKFFVQDHTEWRNMFENSLGIAHPDYPLLLPGSVAWGWLIQGSEFVLWPPVVALLFLLSFYAIILWYLWNFVNPLTGILGTAFTMSLFCILFWATKQYADVPLAFFITAGSIFFILALKIENTALFCLSGAMAGCAAWTKNEGILFSLLLGASTLIALRNQLPAVKVSLLKFFLGAVVPFSAVLTIKIFLTQDNGDYLGSTRGIMDYVLAFFGKPEKTLIIFQSFVEFMKPLAQWNGLWALFFLTWITLPFLPALRQSPGTWFGGLSLMMLLGYFAVLHLAPHDILWQIQTALYRLLIHAAGPALLFIFENWGHLLPPSLSKKN